MNYWQQWAQYIQQMHSQMDAQANKIAEMEKSLVALQVEMRSWKEQKRIHIDKVEYKFDQLKVEQLDGTLNIGLIPSALEELAVNGNAISNEENFAADMDINQAEKQAQPSAELQSDLYRELKQYVEKQVPKQLEQLQAQYNHELDSWHQKVIVDDLKKQSETRVDYYLRQMTPGATEDQLSSIKDSVQFRTQNDIRAAVDSYFNKFINNGTKKEEV